MDEGLSGFCIKGSVPGNGNNGSTGTATKCGRWNPTTEQVKVLTDLFRSGLRTPSTDQIQKISTQLSFYGKIESKNVFYWFQNHKARERQKRRKVSIDKNDFISGDNNKISSSKRFFEAKEYKPERVIETLQLFPLNSFDETDQQEKLRIHANEVPFDDDEKDPSIWFLDHNYHESMFSMFKRINAKEHVVGWYSTGPKLRENDLDIHGLFNDYVPTPVLLIIDVQPKELGIPTKAFCAVEEVKENATQKSQKLFVYVPSEIAAHGVEEIGVEHLLRDRKDTTISTLATEVTGKLPLNHEILYHLQDVFNLLPTLNVEELIKAFAGVVHTVDVIGDLLILNKEHGKTEDSKPVAVSAATGS
ncbi:hypothetical protein CRYUN_Cryun05aG0151500 [Craigia yunnanensis]